MIWEVVRAESATVYRGGGRRWLTLGAACRAEARKKIRARLRESGDEPYDMHDPRYRRLVRTLSHFYRAALLRSTARPSA